MMFSDCNFLAYAIIRPSLKKQGNNSRLNFMSSIMRWAGDSHVWHIQYCTLLYPFEYESHDYNLDSIMSHIYQTITTLENKHFWHFATNSDLLRNLFESGKTMIFLFQAQSTISWTLIIGILLFWGLITQLRNCRLCLEEKYYKLSRLQITKQKKIRAGTKMSPWQELFTFQYGPRLSHIIVIRLKKNISVQHWIFQTCGLELRIRSYFYNC